MRIRNKHNIFLTISLYSSIRFTVWEDYIFFYLDLGNSGIQTINCYYQSKIGSRTNLSRRFKDYVSYRMIHVVHALFTGYYTYRMK